MSKTLRSLHVRHKLMEEEKGKLGLRLAAMYSYPPCKLGFCGVKIKNSSKILSDFILGKKASFGMIKEALKSFEGSYSYYKLIAKANKISHPFDYKVVEAYWLGNHLLEKVKLTDLKSMILKEFTRPGLLNGKQARQKADLIYKSAKPHHSFHVFLIGSVTGRVKFTPKLLDACRIGWGKVVKIKDKRLKSKNNLKKIIVNYKPLKIKKNQYFLGKSINKEISWDKRFVPKLKLGDLIAFHWHRACQVINKQDKQNLLRYTLLNLRCLEYSTSEVA